MRAVLAACVALCMGVAVQAAAQPLAANPADLNGVARTLQAPGATEAPVLLQTDEGFIRFLDAPPQGFYESPAGAKAAGPEAVSKEYVSTHGRAFGAVSGGTSFSTKTVQQNAGLSYVRLNQHYNGVRVFGGQIVTAVRPDGGITTINSHILYATGALDAGSPGTTPTIGANAAIAKAKSEAAVIFPDLDASKFSVAGDAALYIFSPGLLGLEGGVALVWDVLIAADGDLPVREHFFIDAHNGSVRLHYSVVEHALNRTIFDANGTFNRPNTPVRSEGDPPSGIADADAMYDYLGDTYNFYFDHFGRDSFDDQGGELNGLVRLPFFNAFWDPQTQTMEVGEGLAVDDVIGHEVSHGVTQFTSDLIYLGFSGAINESMSDIFGEFIDLTNTGGNDDADVRWLVGEDMTAPGSVEKGLGPKSPPTQRTDTLALRSMSDPTILGQPDKLSSPLLFPPTFIFYDGGGVHTNSGIGNKLCYLLTDGDDFNNQSVRGLGIDRTADLFYGAQLILTESADYFELYLALGAVSKALNMSVTDRLNISAAGQAVEIAPPTLTQVGVSGFRATPTRTLDGDAVIAVTWTNPDIALYDQVTLVRSLGGFVSEPSQGQILAQGRVDRYLDANVSEGVTYYYTLIADLTTGFPQVLFARATAGGDPGTNLTQEFTAGTGPLAQPIDLSFTQLTFTPAGAPIPGVAAATRGYEDYEVTLKKDVFAFPVAREDEEGSAFSILLSDDGAVFHGFGGDTIPLFGKHYGGAWVNANGYISFQSLSDTFELNFPSLAAHFAQPRISYLFSDLAPNIGGDVWTRFLKDRFVVTVENMPEYLVAGPVASAPPNTVQVELYYSGHIRITYGSVGVRHAIVGLSAGTGIPVDPATVFPNVRPVDFDIDFSALPSQHSRLSIDPIASVFEEAGTRIAFTVTTSNAPGAAPPAFIATWDGPGAPPLADLGNGTARFDWPSGVGDDGIYTLRIQAVLGAERAYQDVRFIIGQSAQAPQALDLTISSGTPFEDPTRDHVVDDNQPLMADYRYEHPLAESNPGDYAEGDTLLYWFRNGEMLSGFVNQRTVPAAATHPGDHWYFQVLPSTLNFISGELATSPVVTVQAMPVIQRVTPAFGLVNGGNTVRIEGHRLTGILSVSFGGVPTTSIHAIDESTLEVVAPLHTEGVVDLTIQTSTGATRAVGAYTYVSDLSKITDPDVNADGKIDALDIQLIVDVVLRAATAKAAVNTDVNHDGQTNAADVQSVVNSALRR